MNESRDSSGGIVYSDNSAYQNRLNQIKQAKDINIRSDKQDSLELRVSNLEHIVKDLKNTISDLIGDTT